MILGILVFGFIFIDMAAAQDRFKEPTPLAFTLSDTYFFGSNF